MTMMADDGNHNYDGGGNHNNVGGDNNKYDGGGNHTLLPTVIIVVIAAGIIIVMVINLNGSALSADSTQFDANFGPRTILQNDSRNQSQFDCTKPRTSTKPFVNHEHFV